ncbi:hypothetical protein KAU33_15570 [Candidatus Dependentiae bacterium]|nr:hypothetical protein [Candidatus Dependentiae bacterium]
MNPIIVLVLAIIVHEFGHWIIPHFEGLNPRITIGWIIIGVECDINDWIPIQMFIDTRILGIILGIPVIVILGNVGDLWFLFVAYFLFSSLDIIMIIFLKVKAHRENALLWGELKW